MTKERSNLLMDRFDVALIGMGYVGLTLATALAEAGLKVLGVESNPRIFETIALGTPHFKEKGLDKKFAQAVSSKKIIVTNSLATNANASAYIITVGTPLDKKGKARSDAISYAAKQVANHMKNDALIILRSTVKVGITSGIVAPILASSGKQFKLAMCPERTLEGKALEELNSLPQIIGSSDNASFERAASIFQKITKKIIRVSSFENAEMIKLVDNSFRDLQFAFANEIARICDNLGLDAIEVIESGKDSYGRTKVPMPGLVGGPCLEKDPHILAQSARDHDINPEIIQASRTVNERQPLEASHFIHQEILRRADNHPAKIGILGIAFKGVPSTDDIRGSMGVHVISHLQDRIPDAQISVFDPCVNYPELIEEFPLIEFVDEVEALFLDASAVVITNNNPLFYFDDLGSLLKLAMPQAFIYDFWNLYSSNPGYKFDNNYISVGRASIAKL